MEVSGCENMEDTRVSGISDSTVKAVIMIRIRSSSVSCGGSSSGRIECIVVCG